MKKLHSYTAADQFPLKLAQDYRTIESIVEKQFIPPVHVQLCPTNKCTRQCRFCSCSDRDKSLELPFKAILRIMQEFKKLGCRSVTITGGGEPLLHPSIADIIYSLSEMGISIGLVTNGDVIDRLRALDWANVLWCRISCSDEVEFSDSWWSKVERAIKQAPGVDWAFSYVVKRDHKPENLKKYVQKAKEYNFTHVRVVSNLLDIENVPIVEEPKDPIVLFQNRKTPRPGTKRCWISLLKPVVAADGFLYPCCGIQYAGLSSVKDYSLEARMNLHIKHWINQEPFDGSKCRYCYYTDYNNFLDGLRKELDHRDHV